MTDNVQNIELTRVELGYLKLKLAYSPPMSHGQDIYDKVCGAIDRMNRLVEENRAR